MTSSGIRSQAFCTRTARGKSTQPLRRCNIEISTVGDVAFGWIFTFDRCFLRFPEKESVQKRLCLRIIYIIIAISSSFLLNNEQANKKSFNRRCCDSNFAVNKRRILVIFCATTRAHKSDFFNLFFAKGAFYAHGIQS